MNEIEKRMLKNQVLIMSAISTLPISRESLELLLIGAEKTKKLILPEQTEENACDMDERESFDNEICEGCKRKRKWCVCETSEDKEAKQTLKDFAKRGLEE